jgi:FkbM family methyltransferase
MPMKKHIVKIVNNFLQPLNAKIVRRENFDLSMDSMVQRLARSNVSIRSVVDIGASDGKWSIGCMKYFKNAKFLAVEPLEERRSALEANKRLFANFDYTLCVAGEVDGGKANLNVTEDLDGSTIEGQNPGVSRICTVRTIDSLLDEKKLPKPVSLKV